MRTYITWTYVPGTTLYYVYRFDGILDDVWNHLNEFHEPDGFCIPSNSTYPLERYLGSIDHFQLVGTTTNTYYIDYPPPGPYIYLIRATDEYCAGPVSDPATVTVEALECPPDNGYRYDNFKIEGTYLTNYHKFLRYYGYPVEVNEINIESIYVNDYPMLFAIYDPIDMDNGKYIYIPANITSTAEEVSINSASGYVEITSIPISEWIILYNNGDVEWGPPDTSIAEASFATSLDIRYRITIDGLPEELFNNILEDRITDHKAIEGALLPNRLIVGRIYPVSGIVNKFEIEFTKPTWTDTILQISTSKETKTIVVPSETQTFLYDLELDLEANDYFMIMTGEETSGVSLDIRWEINLGDSIITCIPYNCIDYDNAYIEGNLLNDTEERVVYNYSGMITRIWLHSAYNNTLTEKTTVRLQNDRTKQFTDIIVEPGEHTGFMCNKLSFEPGDLIIVITPDFHTTLSGVNVMWEIWYCGYDILSLPDKGFSSYSYIDGWTFEGQALISNIDRYRTYPFWSHITKFNFDLVYSPPEPIEATLFMNGSPIEKFTIPAGVINMEFDCNLIIPENATITMEFTNSIAAPIVVTWNFDVQSDYNISMFDPLKWFRDHTTIEGANVNEIYAIRKYHKKGKIQFLECQNRYIAEANSYVYLENKSTGDILPLSIPSGTKYNASPGSLLFNQEDEIYLKSDSSGSLVSCNIDWKIYSAEDGYKIGPEYMDLLWFFIEGSLPIGEQVWTHMLESAERLSYIEFSITYFSNVNYTLYLDISSLGEFPINIPAYTKHLIFPLDIDIPKDSLMKLRTDPVVGSFNSSINVNMLFFKTNPCCALAASLVDEGSKIPTDGLGEPSPISGVGGYGG